MASEPALGDLYKTRRWQRARRHFLSQNPLCTMCLEANKLVPATVVDHKIRHRGDMRLFWDRSNWQSLCETHHNGAKQRQDIKGYGGAVGPDGWPLDAKHPANGS